MRERDSINYKKPKQKKTKTRSDSVSSADSRYTESDGEREDLEDSENEEKRKENEKFLHVSERDQPDLTVLMEAEALRELQEQVASLHTKLTLQHKAQQQTATALEHAPIPETVST